MTAQQDSRLRVRDENGVLRVEFIDRNILDEANIQQIGTEITALIAERDEPRLVINFRNVEHLSSAALGTLITVHNKMRAKKGHLRLAEIDQSIYEVFTITKLNTLFEIHDTEESAVASLP